MGEHVTDIYIIVGRPESCMVSEYFEELDWEDDYWLDYADERGIGDED